MTWFVVVVGYYQEVQHMIFAVIVLVWKISCIGLVWFRKI